jgi:hypothetical protein
LLAYPQALFRSCIPGLAFDGIECAHAFDGLAREGKGHALLDEIEKSIEKLRIFLAEKFKREDVL